MHGLYKWLFFAVGVFTVVCTIKKPAFYWESRKARNMRELIGDRGAEIFYVLLGLFLIGVSIFAPVGP